jgi:hypothetical protein
VSATANQLRDAFAALERDLVSESGPQISTMRNYRFALLVYSPQQEFALRREAQRLVASLAHNGWVVLTLSLQALLLQRLRALGDEVLQRIIEMERQTAQRSRQRGLTYLGDKICREIEGPDGIAADVCREIQQFADTHPEKAERTLVLVGRAGALYPFFRTSSLLKHIDGRTRNLPVVLLYPGERRGNAGLSFMGMINPDGDYRPRIY